jgi:hypothetical protein
MKPKHRNLLPLLGLATMALIASPARADVIFSESFESPDTADNSDPLGTPTGWTWVTRNITNILGVFNYANATDGSQIFFGYAGQSYVIRTTDTILNQTVAVDSTYTVTLDFQGYANNRPIRFGIRLLAIDGSNNVTELAADTVSLASGHGLTGTNWNSTFSLAVTPTTHAGERLAIEINQGASGTAGAYIDKMQLSVNTGVVSAPLALKISQSGDNLNFEWNSQAGMQYDLVSSSDLSTNPSTWLPYNDGVTTHENIAASGTGTNNLTGVLKVGPTRFFSLIEEPAP